MINLEWYRIFRQTARTGNLTKAAQDLYITQPSVSYAIKQMEQALGVKLFQRLSKGVKLTAEGRALLDYVERSFALLDSGEKKIEALKRLEDGEVRIGASDSLIKHLLLPQLNTFHTDYPNVRIRLSHGRTPDIIRRLKEDLIDCGIVHMPVSDPELDIKPLIRSEDVFVAGETYRHMAGSPLSAEELVRLPLLLLSSGSSTRSFVEQWFASQGLAVEPDIELGSIDLLIEFARLGYGVAFINRSFVAEELSAGRLIELQPAAEMPSRSIGLAIRRGRMLPLAAERFIGMLV
ncbi:LysR family transcriptional regulator [Paenibacillus tarimensis]